MARKRKEYVYVKTLSYSQKRVAKALIEGGNISHMGTSGIRLRDINQNPIGRVTQRTFYKIKDILVKNKKGLWVLNARAVNRMNPLSWAHKQYSKTNV